MGLRYYNCATAARTRLARLHLCRRLFPWKLPDTPSPYVNKGVGLPSRQLLGWTSRPLPAAVAWPLWIASLSIVGAPPLLGYLAKQRSNSHCD